MLSSIRVAWRLLRRGLEPSQIVVFLEIRRALADCASVLDVGCGQSPTMRWLEISHPTGIDGYQPAVEATRQAGTHDELVLGNVTELEKHFRPGQFEACVALDVIEHLPKEAGYRLMESMERIARRRVVFLTPSGFLPQGHATSGDLQEHLSGWEPAEMASRGYRVIGLLGPKSLRGEYHALKGRPKVWWGLVSLFGHFFLTRSRPERAAAILCIKDRSGGK